MCITKPRSPSKSLFLYPLPGITSHVVKAVGASTSSITRNRLKLLSIDITKRKTKLPIIVRKTLTRLRIPPRIYSAIGTTCSFLPFLFGWKALAIVTTIGIRIRPLDTNDRLVPIKLWPYITPMLWFVTVRRFHEGSIELGSYLIFIYKEFPLWYQNHGHIFFGVPRQIHVTFRASLRLLNFLLIDTPLLSQSFLLYCLLPQLSFPLLLLD